jgi:ankyrin repeat protein
MDKPDQHQPPDNGLPGKTPAAARATGIKSMALGVVMLAMLVPAALSDELLDQAYAPLVLGHPLVVALGLGLLGTSRRGKRPHAIHRVAAWLGFALPPVALMLLLMVVTRLTLNWTALYTHCSVALLPALFFLCAWSERDTGRPLPVLAFVLLAAVPLLLIAWLVILVDAHAGFFGLLTAGSVACTVVGAVVLAIVASVLMPGASSDQQDGSPTPEVRADAQPRLRPAAGATSGSIAVGVVVLASLLVAMGPLRRAADAARFEWNERILQAVQANDAGHLDSLLARAGAGHVLFGDALVTAVVNGEESLTALFLEAGVDVNQRSRLAETTIGTALLAAVHVGDLSLVRRLLNVGANPSEAGSFIPREARRPWAFSKDFLTPLSLAAAEDRPEVVRLLLERGAGPNEVASPAAGRTPLMYAAMTDAVHSLAELQRAEAHVHAADADRRTALHWAAHYGKLDAARALLRTGAKKDVRDEDGLTPADLAKPRDNPRLLQLLKPGA